MNKLRIRTLRKSEQRMDLSEQRRSVAGYPSTVSRSNPHYDRWPSLPLHLPRTLR